MFLGLSAGTIIFLIIFTLVRASASIYNRDIYPYTSNGIRPLIFDFSFELDDDIPHKSEMHCEFVARCNDVHKTDINIQHDQFLKTSLGKAYLHILNGTNK